MFDFSVNLIDFAFNIANALIYLFNFSVDLINFAFNIANALICLFNFSVDLIDFAFNIANVLIDQFNFLFDLIDFLLNVADALIDPVDFLFNPAELLIVWLVRFSLLHIRKDLHHRLRLLLIDPCPLQGFKGLVGLHHGACHVCLSPGNTAIARG